MCYLFLSLSSLPVASLSFVLPVLPFTFPVAEKQELQDMHYEILLPENSMENLSNPSQVITHEKIVHSLIKHGIKCLACGSQYTDGEGFLPNMKKSWIISNTQKAKTTFPSLSDDSGCSWYGLHFSKKRRPRKGNFCSSIVRIKTSSIISWCVRQFWRAQTWQSMVRTHLIHLSCAEVSRSKVSLG